MSAKKTSEEPTAFGGPFFEKITLLVVAALLSGLVIPFVVSAIEYTREKERKEIETALIKKEKIFEAQSKLLEEFSDVALTYQTIALDVTWFGFGIAKNEELQGKSYARYSDRVVDLHARWRVMLSRARTLTSSKIVQKMEDLFRDTLQSQDGAIVQMINDEATPDDWMAQHRANEKMEVRTSETVQSMAIEMGLTRDDLK